MARSLRRCARRTVDWLVCKLRATPVSPQAIHHLLVIIGPSLTHSLLVVTETIEETAIRIQKEKDDLNVWYIIMPDSNFKMVWDLSQVVVSTQAIWLSLLVTRSFFSLKDCLWLQVLLYVASIVPLRIGFSTDADAYSTMWWVELAVDIYFLTDIILNFVMAVRSCLFLLSFCSLFAHILLAFFLAV